MARYKAAARPSVVFPISQGSPWCLSVRNQANFMEEAVA